MTRARDLALALGAFVALLGDAPRDVRTALQSAAISYNANVAAIAKIAGHDATMAYYNRLVDDLASQDATPPPDYDATAFFGSVRDTATLDVSLATQLTQQSYAPMSAIRGIGEALVRSSTDGTMQPIAVFVPSTYAAGRPTPLVVFLHGLGSSETETIGAKIVQTLAESSGAIVVAPYGRGHFDYAGAEVDIYDALDAATSAFTIDPKKRFLAGFSMGGFSVYRVAPLVPHAWSGIMSVSGWLLEREAAAVTRAFPATPFYVVAGERDEVVPSSNSAASAGYLHSFGVPVSYYAEPTGLHRLSSLMPSLAQAWTDMITGVVRPSHFSKSNPLPQNWPP